MSNPSGSSSSGFQVHRPKPSANFEARCSDRERYRAKAVANTFERHAQDAAEEQQDPRLREYRQRVARQIAGPDSPGDDFVGFECVATRERQRMAAPATAEAARAFCSAVANGDPSASFWRNDETTDEDWEFFHRTFGPGACPNKFAKRTCYTAATCGDLPGGGVSTLKRVLNSHPPVAVEAAAWDTCFAEQAHDTWVTVPRYVRALEGQTTGLPTYSAVNSVVDAWLEEQPESDSEDTDYVPRKRPRPTKGFRSTHLH